MNPNIFLILTAGKFEQQIPWDRVAVADGSNPETTLSQFLVTPQYPWLKYLDSLGNPSWVNLSKFRKVTIKYA